MYLLLGSEDYFVVTKEAKARQHIKKNTQDVEEIILDANIITPHDLTQALSPSLFSTGHTTLILRNLQNSTEYLLDELQRSLASLSEGYFLIAEHNGSVKNKKLLDYLKSLNPTIVDCSTLKNDKDKHSYVHQQFHAANVPVTAEAVNKLVEAVGSNVSELAAMTDQLIDIYPSLKSVSKNVQQSLSLEIVEKFVGSRVEVTVFKVIDAVMKKDLDRALQNFRYAQDTGIDVVPLIAALAQRIRSLAKIASYKGENIQKDLGMSQWQIDNLKRELVYWRPKTITQAVSAVADADAQVKGMGKDPAYAVEKALIQLCTSS